MGKKKNYESPYIKRSQVETESGFCAASVIENPRDKGIKTEGHEIGETIDATDWENDNGWQ